MAKRSKADVKYAIDLLWSHQIRRENAALHKEVKGLQQQVTVQADEVRELCLASKKAKMAADTAIACFEKALADQATLQTTVDTAHQQAQDALNRATSLETTLREARADQNQIITHFKKDTDKLKAEIAQLRQQRQVELSQTGASFRQILTQLDEKCAKYEIAALKNRLEEIETFRHPGHTLQSISHVEDSFGKAEYGAYGNDKVRREQILTCQSQNGGSNRSSNRPPLKNKNDETEMMLTLRDGHDRDVSTEVEEIDLDQNVATIGHEMNMGLDVPVADSFALLFENELNTIETNITQPLKQGRFHSWDRYFAEGQALVSKLPRRHEFNIVQCFIEGLYARSQRAQCVGWLDVNGWTWESVSGFGLQVSSTPCVPLHLESIDHRKAAQPAGTTKHEPGGVRDHDDGDWLVSRLPRRMAKKSNQSPTPDPQCSAAEQNADASNPRLSQGRHAFKLASSMWAQKGLNSNKTLTQPSRDTKGRFISKPPGVLVAGSVQDTACATKQGRKKSGPTITNSAKGHNLPATSTSVGTSEQRVEAVLPVGNISTASKLVQAAQERPSTPNRQRNLLDGPEQPAPRLVKRKRRIDRVIEKEGKKARRLVAEEGLPPFPVRLVQQDCKERAGKGKARRLPLPPPPEIPIMPTSDVEY